MKSYDKKQIVNLILEIDEIKDYLEKAQEELKEVQDLISSTLAKVEDSYTACRQILDK